MGAAAILAVFDAISKVAGAIKGVYDVVKMADAFFSGASDWDQVRAVISSQILHRNQILQVSADILDAVAQLDRRIFLANIADKLGDSDQAVVAVDTWKRTGSTDQSAIALNESAGALADVLRYSNGNVYPNTSLVFPLIEVLIVRVLVLKEADPSFVRSPISRRPIEDSVQLIRTTADGMQTAIEQANAIRVDSEVVTRSRVLPASVGGGRETVRVLRLAASYRNIDGTVSFERRGEFEPEDGDFDEIIAQAHADAAAARQRGLAHDLERARLSVLREAADVAERCLLVAEAHWSSSVLLQRPPTDLEIATFVAQRQRASFEDVALTVGAYMDLSKDSLQALTTELSGHEIEAAQQESLWNVMETFGQPAVLKMLLTAGSRDEQRERGPGQ